MEVRIFTSEPSHPEFPKFSEQPKTEAVTEVVEKTKKEIVKTEPRTEKVVLTALLEATEKVPVETLSEQPEGISEEIVSLLEAPLLMNRAELVSRDEKEHVTAKSETEKTSSDLIPSPKVGEPDDPALSTDQLASEASQNQQQLTASLQTEMAAREIKKGIEGRLREQLEAAKYYPASARRRGIVGDVEVGFAVNRVGVAEQVLILASSGYAVLDRAALDTVVRAQPFAASGGTFQFRLSFRKL